MKVLICGQIPQGEGELNFAQSLGEIANIPDIYSGELLDPSVRQQVLEDEANEGWIIYGAEHIKCDDYVDAADGLIIFDFDYPKTNPKAWRAGVRAVEQGKPVTILSSQNEAWMALSALRNQVAARSV